MSTLPQTFVVITPRELKFENVRINEAHIERIHLQNTLSHPVNIELKASNSLRYSISDTNITLQSNQSKHIDIQLKLTKPIHSKCKPHKIKDIFYIKSEFFNDHITASIIMQHNESTKNHHDIDIDIDCSSSSEIHDLQTQTPTKIQNDNKNLRDYVHRLENNMSELKIELNHLQTVKSQINATIPNLETIIDATIGEERALNEVRNKKVLQILQCKDEDIDNLKEMNRNYQATEATLHVLQTKHVHLTQTYTETQHENDEIRHSLNLHKQEIIKLNDKITSYEQQTQFQKKIINERDLRIEELTNDIQQTQNMLQHSTQTMKRSYTEQMQELQHKLNVANNNIQQMHDEFNETEIKYKNELVSLTQIMDENRVLKENKDKQQNTFKTELEQIQKDTFHDTVSTDIGNEEYINHLQIELAKLRSFVRLGLFSNDQNIIDYQNGKNINKQMMNDLARKSAHLSASQAIIKQQRDRIYELEKIQKMTNQSTFQQSIKLNESNKQLNSNSSEHLRLLTIHKRQIEILNKKLSDSIKREEERHIKLKNMKQKLNASESEYIDKIEELEQALEAINTMHQKTKRNTSRRNGDCKDNQKLIEIVKIENKWMNTQHELVSVRKKLKHEMTQRKLDIKAHDIKLHNTKAMYEKQMLRLQGIVDGMKKKDTNIHRLIQLNNELGQSEQLKNEYLTEIQIMKDKMKELQLHDTPPPIHTKYKSTMNKKRDELLLAMNEECFKQKQEIEDLENMMNAAISELKKYNPHIIDKLKNIKHSKRVINAPTSTVSTDSSNIITYEKDSICANDQISKIKQICDDEIQRYQQLYENIDNEYQSYKKKINQEIQHKDECYLNELAQQKFQITKLQSEIAESRKLHLHQQEKCETLAITNQSLAAKLEQHLELQTQNHVHTECVPRNNTSVASKIKESDIKRMEEVITHQEAQIQVLINTIEALQHHKPKKSQIVELTGRIAMHETLETQRKKELECMRSKWIKNEDNNGILEKQCANLRTKLKSLTFELENNKKQSNNIRDRFENYQREIIEKDNKIHELELTQSRLQSIRKQLESRANIMQNELDHLSKQHFQHIQTLSTEHQHQLKKWSKLYGNDNDTEHDATATMNHSLQSNISNDFYDSLKGLSHLLEKYLIHEQQLFDQDKKQLGLTSIEYESLMNSFKDGNKGKALTSLHTIQDKHHFMKQLMNIVHDQYGNIISLQKQTQFYEWLSRHHYTKRRESETNVLSLQCELQVCKKHVKRVKDDIDHNHIVMQQQIQQRKELMKEQMNKAIHRYVALETTCNTLKSDINAKKKQCVQYESKYYIVLNELNRKDIDVTEKETQLKQHIVDDMSMNSSARDKKLKEYLHDHLKKIIQETVRRYQKDDLYENQVFELSNEILSLKYVQSELTQQLEKAMYENQEDKNTNKRLQQTIKNSNNYYEKMKVHAQNENKGKGTSNNSSMSNSVCHSPNKEHKHMKSTQDVSIMVLEQDLCDKKMENEALHNSINCLQKEIEELFEKNNLCKIKHENELKNMREQIGDEREILIQNHHNEMANNHQQHQQKMQKLQNEMEQVAKRVRPWTDSLDLNQLKQTVESQSHELSRANIHLQTLRTKITQLEYESSDNEKEIESQKFVIDHLQDTIKLFSTNNETKDDRALKPCTHTIVSTICKELIKARKSQCNAMIKLRVASQSEIELQETISAREKRINELKKHLNMTKSSSGKGQVVDIMKNDRKLDELILEIASKDAEIRYLKKKLAIEQTKITVVYDIEPLQELVGKIDAYCYNQLGTTLPFKGKRQKHHNTQHHQDMDTLQKQINGLQQENNRLRDSQCNYTPDNVKHDRLEISQSKNKLVYLVEEMNGYINKIKSVCNVSLSKASQRTTLKLKKIEDLCKLQHIKITACSDQMNNLLINVVQRVDIVNEQYEGLQIAHKRLQQHVADEKTKYIEMEQELNDIRITLNTYKSAEKHRNGIQTSNHCAQTDDIPIDFETKSKIISLQNTIDSLRKSKCLETQDWREDVVSLHEQLLQSKIDVNRYQTECEELQYMYLELKSQLESNHNINHCIKSPKPRISDHRLELQSIELKRKISSLQRQLNEAHNKWKASETKYQKLLSHNIELKQKSDSLEDAVKQSDGDNKHRLSEFESICDTLQRELDDTKCEYEKQCMEYNRLKDKNNKLKLKNKELNQKTLTIERRSDEERSRLREQLISAQSEKKKIRDLVQELQHEIVEKETNLNQIKCDKDADIEITNQTHESKLRDLRVKYDEDISDRNKQIKQLKEVYEEEQEHHTQHFSQIMQEFDEYKDTQRRAQNMYDAQLTLLKKRFENAMIAEQERLCYMSESHSVHSSTTSLRKMKSVKSPSSTRSRSFGKSQSMSRICVSDYSSLLYDLSQRDSAIKSLKNEVKSLKLVLRRKEKEYHKILNKGKGKKGSILSPNKDKTHSLFEIRASAVWSARLAHCTIQIRELKKKLEFEQESMIEKEEDIEKYTFENKELKVRIVNINKKLDHQINIKSKHHQSFECQRQNWRMKDREWNQEKERLNLDLSECKKTMKRLREDIHRKEDIMKQIKGENEKIKHKMETIKLKNKSMSFSHSDQYKELNKDIEAIRNRLNLKESLFSDLKRKYDKLQNNIDKMQLNNHELHSKNRTANAEISRKDMLINELKHKLEDTERENICNKSNTDLITKLKQKCKQLKSNEKRKDELWRANKHRLETVMKEFNMVKQQKTQKQSKMMTKLNKIQNDEQSIAKKYETVRNEALELKTIMDTLYHNLAVINDDLMSTLNDVQTNYYKGYNENMNNGNIGNIESDDTLKAARIVDGFSVNELEEIMNCKEEKYMHKHKRSSSSNHLSSPKKIQWQQCTEKTFILQLFEKIINERIRLEMMINKMKMHQKASKNYQNDQFEKIKLKHQQHLNEYQTILKKVRKHK